MHQASQSPDYAIQPGSSQPSGRTAASEDPRPPLLLGRRGGKLDHASAVHEEGAAQAAQEGADLVKAQQSDSEPAERKTAQRGASGWHTLRCERNG